MKKLRLHEQHLAQSAVFGESAGWEVPMYYGAAEAEYAAVRQHVGVADLSHRGMLRIIGEDRVKWLQSLISNDILSLSPGQGVYSAFLTHKGKMLSYFRVYMQPESILVEDVGEIGDTTFQALRKFLLYGTNAKMEQGSGAWGLLLVSGPKAADLIKAAFGADVGTLKPLAFIAQEIGGRQALLIRTEETGETDIEIIIPTEGLNAAWERLWAAGTSLGLRAVGAEVREVLRIEAGLPKAGADLTEEVGPLEASLEGKAFSLTKGCYPGQEVVARMDTYGSIRRRMVGLALSERIFPPKRAKLFSGEREVGWVSSAAHSPSLGYSIALGFPLRDFTTPGTALSVEIDGHRYDATVRALPFINGTR